MRIAARIKQIRFQCSLSLKDLEAKTGFAETLMARLEKRQDVPTLEMLDTLADALGVPVYKFFYDMAEPQSTPWLTPRLDLRELAEECQGPSTSVPLSKPKRSVPAAIKAWSGWPH